MKLKRAVAFFLSFMMMFSLAGENAATVFAAEPSQEVISEETEPADEASQGAVSDEAEPADEVSQGAVSDEAEPADEASSGAVSEQPELTEEELAELAENARPIEVEEIDRDSLDVDFLDPDAAGNEMSDALEQIKTDAAEEVRVIVLMDDESIIEEDASASVDSASLAQAEDLEQAQDDVIETIEEEVLDHEPLAVSYHYTWLLNGFAAKVPYGKIHEIEAIDGVQKVLLQPVYQPLATDSDETAGADENGDEIGIRPMTNTEGPMIGRDDAWTAGYAGEGMKISIIDTGLDDDHPSFGELPQSIYEEYQSSYEKEEDVKEVLPSLHAYATYNGGGVLTTEGVYRSTKVPYGFNYVDNSLRIDHRDNQGTHGTHVAGIAAANPLETTDVVGVAPQAQLYVMKVFGTNGGAYTEDLLAALEDSMKLGADVINMSLGSPAGFTEDSDEVNAIYARVNTTGSILSIAAGNSGAMGQGNLWGSGSNLTSNPDNSLVSSPATYEGALSVASSEKLTLKSYCVTLNGKNYIFSDGSNGPNRPLRSLSGQNLQVAVVNGFGADIAEFEEADVAGKVALVQRGGMVNFTTKCDNAEAAGAVACLIYNNEKGSLGIDMTGGSATIPCAIISMTAGEEIAAAVTADPSLEMTISKEMEVVDNEMAGQMSNFSSWGATPDLHLEPDITAPGSGIYSTVDGGGYESMDGTSMAAPNLAGISALVLQYVQKTYPEKSANEQKQLVHALLMSTAEPLVYNGNGVYFSPRNQGAGLANADKAIRTRSVLAVDGMDVPKAELGDNQEGVYSFQFTVENFGDEAASYHLASSVQTEDVMELEDYPGVEFMATTPKQLSTKAVVSSDSLSLIYDYNRNEKINSHDAYLLWRMALGKDPVPEDPDLRCDVLADETVDTEDVQAYLDELVEKDRVDSEGEGIDLFDVGSLVVEPGTTETINVSISLRADDKAWMNQHFANGIYVEGFVFLNADDEDAVDLSLPYMGFYGDWTKAPIFDGGYYWDSYFSGTSDVPTASQYVNILWTNYLNQASEWLPGINPYVASEDFDPAHLSLSPNGDGFADYVDDIYVSLLRNADELSFTWKDADGEILDQLTIDHAPKSYYSDAYAQIIPFIYSWYGYPYDLTDQSGAVLENASKVTLEVAAKLDYDKHASNNESDVWTTVFTVDLNAPKLLGDKAEFSYLDDGRQFVKLTVSDEVSVAAVNFYNRRETMPLADPYALDDATEGVRMDDGSIVYEKWFDVTGFGNEFALILGDYAFNERAYILHTEGNDPVLDPDQLYGYRIGDDVYPNESLYGWVGIDPETAETTVYDTEYFMDFSLNAAEYVDGYILAADTNSTLGGGDHLVWIRPGYWEERTMISELQGDFGGIGVREMALDPAGGTLYIVSNDRSYPTCALYTVDIRTGEARLVSDQTDDYGTPRSPELDLWAMTCSDDGTMYAVDDSGMLKTIDTETGDWGDELFDTTSVTGERPAHSQSMTYSSKEQCIYWAFYSADDNHGKLYRIDQLTGTPSMTEVGPIDEYPDGRAEIVGLMMLDGRGYSLPEAELEEIHFSEESMSLIVGESDSFDVISTPWYLAPDKLTWESSNPEVATIGETGVIRAVSVGETTVTAKTADGAFEAVGTVSVTQPTSTLYGFAGFGQTVNNQWLAFNAVSVSDFDTLSQSAFSGYIAGEYLDGYIYAFDDQSMAFWRVDPNNGFEATKLAAGQSDYQIFDLAYNYSDGYLYAIGMDNNSYTGVLLHVDPMSGAIEPVCELTDGMGYALGISTEGVLYTVDDYGALCTVNPETGELQGVGGITGYTAGFSTSMAYDHTNGQLYWSTMEGIVYLDLNSGKGSLLGSVEDGVLVTALFADPGEELPEREPVAVEDVSLEETTMTVLDGAGRRVPVQVEPFNATDRNIVWRVADQSIAYIEDGILTGLKAGETTAVGTLADKSVTLNIEVKPSTGYIYAFVEGDMSGMAQYFWAQFADTDPGAAGGALTDVCSYELTAGEYYDGKIYGFGFDEASYDPVFIVADANTYETESYLMGDYPDIHDMALDYSQGVMYATGGKRNTDVDTLYCVDIATGDCYEIGKTDPGLSAITCIGDTLYGIGVDGVLYQVDKETAALDAIGETGYLSSGMYQSMTYDYDTGNLYWAQIGDAGGWMPMPRTDGLMLVDPSTGKATPLGLPGLAGCQLTALHTRAVSAPEVGTVDPTKLSLSSSSEMIGVGDSFTLKAQLMPVTVKPRDQQISYRSSNDAVASVSDDGLVTGAAPGSAEITVTAGELSASCTVNVVGEDTVVYVATAHNLKTFPLMDPMTQKSEVDIEGAPALTAADYNPADGLFYGVGEDGYLYQFDAQGTAKRVGTARILDQLDDTYEFTNLDSDFDPATVKDITYNAASGKMYIMVYGDIGDWDLHHVLYELDLSSGAGTYVCDIPTADGTISPKALAFVNAEEYLVYDELMDYVYKMRLGSENATALVWMQDVLASGEYVGMAYNAALKKVFFATSDYSYNNGSVLFVVDPVTGKAQRVGDADYGDDMVDLMFVTGPVSTVSMETPEPASEPAAEPVNGSEEAETTEPVKQETPVAPTEVPGDVTDSDAENTEDSQTAENPEGSDLEDSDLEGSDSDASDEAEPTPQTPEPETSSQE